MSSLGQGPESSEGGWRHNRAVGVAAAIIVLLTFGIVMRGCGCGCSCARDDDGPRRGKATVVCCLCGAVYHVSYKAAGVTKEEMDAGTCLGKPVEQLCPLCSAREGRIAFHCHKCGKAFVPHEEGKLPHKCPFCGKDPQTP